MEKLINTSCIKPMTRKYFGLKSIRGRIAGHRDVKSADIKSEDKILDAMVYACDPLTGLPQDCMAAFMSENTSPQVKKYIEEQFLCPHNDIQNRSDLTDDERLAFTRRPDEGRQEYLQRLATDFSIMFKANEKGGQ